MSFFNNKQKIKALFIVGFLTVISISTLDSVSAADIKTNVYVGVSPNPVQVDQP